jgi:hypothetical protein
VVAGGLGCGQSTGAKGGGGRRDGAGGGMAARGSAAARRGCGCGWGGHNWGGRAARRWTAATEREGEEEKKISCYFRRLCQRPPKIIVFSAAVSEATENKFLFSAPKPWPLKMVCSAVVTYFSPLAISTVSACNLDSVHPPRSYNSAVVALLLPHEPGPYKHHPLGANDHLGSVFV